MLWLHGVHWHGRALHRCLVPAAPRRRAGTALHGEEGTALTRAARLGVQAYSRDVLSFIFIVLTAVNVWKASRKYKAPDMLNRQQTDEWKGWMQVWCACTASKRAIPAPPKVLHILHKRVAWSQSSNCLYW